MFLHFYIIGSQMEAGCGTEVLWIRVCKVSGDVVIDEILDGDTRVEDLKLMIAEIEHIPPHQQHHLVETLLSFFFVLTGHFKSISNASE